VLQRRAHWASCPVDAALPQFAYDTSRQLFVTVESAAIATSYSLARGNDPRESIDSPDLQTCLPACQHTTVRLETDM
jgi:hypothetical protein